MAPGASFCNQCGNKIGGGGGGGGHRPAGAAAIGGQHLPWWIAGAAMFLLIMFVGISMVQPGGPAMPGGAPPVPALGSGNGTPPDLSSMTPIDAATRLLNRVMAASSAGDSTEAQAFTPMAIGLYLLFAGT